MAGKILSRLGTRGRKFLLFGTALLLSLYLVIYLVIYWFLVSARGQNWIERSLSSRLGISARWEAATVSPLLEPSLRGVTLEITSRHAPPRQLHVREMVFRWSIGGDQGVYLGGIDSISGLAEGVTAQVSGVDVAWEPWAEARRLSLEVDRPEVGIVLGGGEMSVTTDLQDVRGALGGVYEIAQTTLGKLVVTGGRISIKDQGGVTELRNVSIIRDPSTRPLRVFGQATAQSGTKIRFEGHLSGGSPSDVTAEIFVTSPDLDWLPGPLVQSWVPEVLRGPVSLLTSVSTTESLTLFVDSSELSLSDARLLSRRETPEGIPLSQRAVFLEVSSVSPLSATVAANLQDVPLSQPLLGLSARAVSASGTICFTGSPTGEMNLAGAFDHLDYSTGGLRVIVPAGGFKVRGNVNPQVGLRDGVFDFHAEPSHLAVGSRQLDVPSLAISVKGFETAGRNAVAVKQIDATLGGIGRMSGDLVGSISPSLSVSGAVEGQRLPLVGLWQIGGGPETEWKPEAGTVDISSRFRLDSQAVEISAHAAVANVAVPGTTVTAGQLEIKSEAIWRGDGLLNGAASVSVSDLLWRSLKLPQFSLSAQVSQTAWDAPILISQINASCNLFSATGQVELVLDDRGPQSLVYDTTIRFEDLSKTYADLAEILKEIHLDGIDVGGRVTVRLSGGWVRERDWHTSAQAAIDENHVLAGGREIPAQWENLNARLDLKARGDEKGVIKTEAQGMLSDFGALIGNYDVDVSGRSFAFSLSGAYDQPGRSCSLESFTLQAPGRLSGQVQGSWAADGYRLAATLSTPDLAGSYESFLKDLLVDGWPEAATLVIGGSAQATMAVMRDSHGLRADGNLGLTNGSAQLSSKIGLRGISAFLSAGLDRPVTGAPRLEPRQPMQLTAGQIQWGSNVVKDLVMRPRITDGNILWEDTLSIPLYADQMEIGPVLIAALPSPDWLLRSSLRLRRGAPQSGLEPGEILPTASEVSADWPEVTISKNVLAATGEMSLRIFDGLAKVTGIRVWQFFSSYPIWGGDLTFKAMNLARVCDWLGLERMEGRVSGSIKKLELSIGEEIKPLSFDLDVESDSGGGIISREALKMIYDMGQQASTRIMLDRSQYAYGRLGLRAKLQKDHFFLWGKFKDGDMYYFVEPPSFLSRLIPGKFHTVRIALNSPNRELSFDDVWSRVKAVSKPGLEQARIEISFFRRVNPF